MGIRVLSRDTIDKIAAGEVVERPLNVVKELVENSMDAGACAITVEIAGGGSQLIRVTDDGKGISAEQVEIAFLRHATSKIESADDLMRLNSLGFRGEALSSISAVSRLTMVTKTDEALLGIQYTSDVAPGMDRLKEVGAPKGTTVIVRELFYNVPARRKFLKSQTIEAGAITELMEELALSRPDIAFKYIINKKQRFATTGNGNLKDVIYRIYGREVRDNLIFVEGESEALSGRITGYIGNQFTDRGLRDRESFFLNGRYLRSELLSEAVEAAFKGYLMQHRFPFCVLHLDMEPSLFDVNVHPAKLQVRFSEGDAVKAMVYEACKAALSERESIKSISFTEREDAAQAQREQTELNTSAVPEPFEYAKRESAANNNNIETSANIKESPANVKESPTNIKESPANIKESPANIKESPANIKESPANIKETTSIINEPPGEYFYVAKDDEEWDIDFGDGGVDSSESGHRSTDDSLYDIKSGVGINPDDDEAIPKDTHIFDNGPVIKDEKQLELFEDKLIVPEKRQEYRVIGQVFDTYYLIQLGDELLIMDQHAAHEKVKYEAIVKSVEESSPASAGIVPPIVLTLTGRQEALYDQYREYFEKLGFEVESLGDGTIAIRAVPMELYGRRESELFMDILDELYEKSPGKAPEVILSKLASMACKAAVKGNAPLSLQEASSLLDQLLVLDNPYHCPHGRPTIIKMSKQELEKRFKRIV